MMKKLKLYFDTSVISHLYVDDAPEKMRETYLLWDDVKTGVYEIVLSGVVFQEIQDCYEPKIQMMRDSLEMIEFTNIEVTDEINAIADEIIRQEILAPKHIADCRHIGCAIVSQCDYIVSWNFKHMVNIKTVNGVRAITTLLHYKPIDIISPSMLVNKED